MSDELAKSEERIDDLKIYLFLPSVISVSRRFARGLRMASHYLLVLKRLFSSDPLRLKRSEAVPGSGEN